MQPAQAHDLHGFDGVDELLFEEVMQSADLAHRLADCESKLTAVYARLQGARERIDRLEEDNHGLKEQNHLLQERVLTMRFVDRPHAADQPVFG